MARRAVGAALAFAGLAMAALPAGAVEAGFDCTKAERTIDRFICSQAMLRWHDLALSRSYVQARNKVEGAARDDLLVAQRDWLRERDRRCIGDQPFSVLADSTAPSAQTAYDCLDSVYSERRRELQDAALPPLVPLAVEQVDLGPIAQARPELAEAAGIVLAGVEISPDSSHLALSLPSLEIDLPDQAWLYRLSDKRLVAATPQPDMNDPHLGDAVAAIRSIGWDNGELFARVALWGGDGEGEEGTTAVFAATVEGTKRLEDVPGHIYALLEESRGVGTAVGQDDVPESDWDILDAIQGNADFLVFADDRGHGTIELILRKRGKDAPNFLVAWGSHELSRHLFDPDRSLIVHAADTGIVLFDMATHGVQRIGGTGRGDLPLAISVDLGLLVWSTRNRCGDEFLALPEEDAPERLCLARLPARGAVTP